MGEGGEFPAKTVTHVAARRRAGGRREGGGEQQAHLTAKSLCPFSPPSPTLL